MKTITITQPSREQARKTLKQLKFSGKDCKLIDNGNHLKSNDRWHILVKGRETLPAPRKPKGNTMLGYDIKTCQNAPQWLKTTKEKAINVYHKISRTTQFNNMHVEV